MIHEPNAPAGQAPARLVCADLKLGNVTNHGGKVSRDLMTYGSFVKIDPNTTLVGSASLVRSEKGETSVRVQVSGLLPNLGYAAHVHVGGCAELLGHYLIDPAQPGGAANEIWPSVTTNGTGEGIGTAVVPTYARPEAASIVVHDPATNARLACADLVFGGVTTASGDFIKLTAGQATNIAGSAWLRRTSS